MHGKTTIKKEVSSFNAFPFEAKVFPRHYVKKLLYLSLEPHVVINCPRNFLHIYKKKVKQSRYSPGVAQRIPGS
jgi:hypothetical protein